MITYIVAASREDAHAFANKRWVALWRHLHGVMQVRYVQEGDTVLLAPGWLKILNADRIAQALLRHGLLTDVAEVVERAKEAREYKTASKTQRDLKDARRAVGDALVSRTQGFKGGWMSSVMMREVAPVASTRMIPVIARSFGYVSHPALDGGRTTGIMIAPEGFRRTRLYVRENTALYHLDSRSAQAHYANAQRDQLPIYVNK